MTEKIKTPSILTPVFTVLFCDLETPNELSGKYRVVALWEAGTNLDAVRAAIKDVATQKWGKQIPKNLKLPLKKPEDANKPEYYAEGSIHAAMSTKRPYLVARDGRSTLTPDEFSPGCKCRAIIHAWPYDAMGAQQPPGVSLFFDTLQFVSEGSFNRGNIQKMLDENPIEEDTADTMSDADDSDVPF